MPKKRAASEAERTLPSNLEAERSVLGAILIHNDAFDPATAVLRGEDFYRDAHRRIFNAMARLMERKSVIDFVTLKEELGRSGDMEHVGGPAYLSGLTDGVPRATNVKSYAGIVRDKAVLRNVIYAANKVLTDAYDAEESVDEILSRADRSFLDLSTTGRNEDGRMVAMADSMGEMFARIEHRHEHRGELQGVTSGFKEVDELTLGYQPGDLVIMAARPSIGKTSSTIHTIIAAAEMQKVRSVVFSLEMRRSQLQDRILAVLSGVDARRIRSGHFGAADFDAIGAAMERMRALPITIDDKAGRNALYIRQACRRLKAEQGLGLVVIDYVQLMPGCLEGRNPTRNEQVTDIATRLKELADDLSCPIILLSQLSRANDKRPDPRPKLSDLRESGSLEQVADIVAFLHRRHHREGGTTKFILEKARNGPTGEVNVTVDLDTQRWSDGGEDPPEPEPKPRRKKGQQAALPGGDE